MKAVVHDRFTRRLMLMIINNAIVAGINLKQRRNKQKATKIIMKQK